MARIMAEYGPTTEEGGEGEKQEAAAIAPAQASVKKVTADGTYATQSALTISTLAFFMGFQLLPWSYL